MINSLRRAYYNGFSTFYDRFVDFHSRNKQGPARKFLADRLPVEEGATVLDICTGTATLLSHLQEKVGRDGLVAGVDFSSGMLKVARNKVKRFVNIHLVEADQGTFASPSWVPEGPSESFVMMVARGMGWEAYHHTTEAPIIPVLTTNGTIDDAAKEIISRTITNHTERLH